MTNYAYFDSSRSEDGFFRTDAEGNLIPPVDSFQEVPAYNKLVLADVISFCKGVLSENLVAVYFRGSRLLDSAASDFDTVLLTRRPVNHDLGKLLNGRLSARFLNIKHYDTLTMTVDELFADRSLQFIVKVLSVRTYGPPVEEEIMPFRIDRNLAFFLPKIDEKLQVVRALAFRDLSRTEKQQVVNYAVKFTLRAAFELVVERYQRYTRDIELCATIFGDYYPDLKPQAQKILSLYSTGTNVDDVTKVVGSIDDFVSILKHEYVKVYENQETAI